MALATLATAKEMGLEVPRDLSIVSFDNTPIVNFTEPKLTAVDQPVAATASKAIEMIIRQLRGEEVPKEPIVVEAGLVTRDSTAAPLGL